MICGAFSLKKNYKKTNDKHRFMLYNNTVVDKCAKEREVYMPKVCNIERTIFAIEEVQVNFLNKDGTNVKGNLKLDAPNYKAIKKTKNSASVSFLIKKLKSQYAGYDFEVLDGNGNKVRGNTLLSTVRDTYIEDD